MVLVVVGSIPTGHPKEQWQAVVMIRSLKREKELIVANPEALLLPVTLKNPKLFFILFL